jgi:putative transposase
MFHVCNRALGRRSAFETEPDVRFFLGLLQRAVERQQLTVFAYVVLTTHFHLLVHAPEGSLAPAVKWVEQQFVQHFNRLRDRDGPLFRGRFFSRPVEGYADLCLLVRYIDENAVAAGLVTDPADYSHGSAWHYARRVGPSWLSRRLLERAACGDEPYRPRAYAECFHWKLTSGQRALVERRLATRCACGPLDNLVQDAPTAVREWLESRARIADGVQVKEVILAPESIVAECERSRSAADEPWHVACSRKKTSGWQLAMAGLLRTAAGLTFAEIGRLSGVSKDVAFRLAADHVATLRRDPAYVERVGDLLRGALLKELGPLANPRQLVPTPL